LSSSGDLLATGGTDSSVRLWDLEHQSCKSNLTGFQGVTRYNVTPFSVLCIIDPCINSNDSSFSCSVLVFHPNQKLVLAAGDDCTIVGWKVETAKPEFVLKGHFSRVTQIEIHPNEKHAVRYDTVKVLPPSLNN